MEAELIEKGINLFNSHFFFECHEELEKVWLKKHGEEKLFLQGIIQTASAFVHFQRNYLKGAKSLLLHGREKFKGIELNYFNIDLNDFLNEISRCLNELEKISLNEKEKDSFIFPDIKRKK
ncbi:MAG TPA: DUF309 domain-containing protein [archaeon]|nr:DUF309 domain-containing protein [archaeon]